MAAASGLPLVPAEKRNPRITTTYGTGELMRAALDAGLRKIALGDKTQETKTDAAESQSTIGDGVRQAGREIKDAGRKVGRAVVTRCADGRQTL